MTDTVQIALIVSAAPTITAAWAVILGVLNRKKLENIDRNMDGKLSRLLDEKDQDKSQLDDARSKLSRAEGRREGIESKENQ